MNDEQRLAARRRMRPKFRKLRQLEARGVIPYSVWDFSEKGERSRKQRQEKARQWLKDHPDDKDLEK